MAVFAVWLASATLAPEPESFSPAVAQLSPVAAVHAQALTLGSNQGVRKPAVGGVRYSNVAGTLTYLPSWHLPSDTAEPVDTSHVATQNVAYSLDLTIRASVSQDAPSGTITFSRVSDTCTGDYPAGLTLTDGVLSGTPTTIESCSVTFRATFAPDTGTGGTADQAFSFDVINPDSQAPSAPLNLRQVSRTETSITFQVDACSDASGIQNYYLYRTANPSGPTPALKATSATTTLVDTDVVAADAKYYTAKCDDNSAAHNLSSASAEIQATAFDSGGGGGGGGSCPVALAFEDEFEGTSITYSNAFWNNSTNGSGGTHTTSTTRKRGGTRSARGTLTSTSSNYRQELRLNDNGGQHQDWFTDIWYGFSFYLENWSNEDEWEIFWQTHDYLTAGDDAKSNPVLNIEHSNGSTHISRRWNHTDPFLKANQQSQSYNIAALGYNVWHDFVIHVVYDYRNNGASNVGEVEIWRGSGAGSTMTKILTCSPPNCPIGFAEPSGTPAPFWKMGVYRNRNVAVTSRVFYHDSFRVCTGSQCTFACVDPVTNDGARQ